jgi:hypothetical protein
MWKLSSLWRAAIVGAATTLATITVFPIGEEVAVEFTRKKGWIIGSVDLLDYAVDRVRVLLHEPLFWTGWAFIIGLLIGSVVDWMLRKLDGLREAERRRDLLNLGHQVAAAAIDMLPRDLDDDRLTHPVGISKVITLLHELRRFQIPLPEGETNPRTDLGARRLRSFLAALVPPLLAGNLELARDVHLWFGTSETT